MSRKVLTESELDLQEFQLELKEFDKGVKDELRAQAACRKDILRDIAKAEKLVAKEKATRSR